MADTINAERDDKLAALNSATLGVEMPQITLPDGSKVQTGTVGALLVNIRAYNEAHSTGGLEKKTQLEALMRATLPLLDRVGLFDLFRPEEWIAGDNEGRKAVGRLYQEFKLQQQQQQ
ncbi:uncharacterized protein GGS25DRAFT_317082 [Hypoxylon fragiforme]|uniref:uncharacterized protein n=1 Tax=Hypoxylon fragiforme TaxID=63214 RepID=UPI0020C6C886|nr:uncharacterized protein GGS25DRAFT_317082 [Hypoxylon fragiforme]KAI2607054.1 hypothetical protein GGS25DRAFT_317082 [Hypoxylon fragiforme]